MKKLLIALFITAALVIAAKSKITVNKLEFMDLPAEVAYKGEVCNKVQYEDKTGTNIIVTSETGPYPGRPQGENPTQSADLYAYRYLKKGRKYIKVWDITDGVKNSPLTVEAQFIRKTFEVTDLDNDGIAEVWLMYALMDRGDVSGDAMKIIMYEGDRKYSLRGRSRVRAGENEFDGGEYKMDNVFLAGPDVFRKFAKKLWEENIEGLRLNRE